MYGNNLNYNIELKPLFTSPAAKAFSEDAFRLVQEKFQQEAINIQQTSMDTHDESPVLAEFEALYKSSDFCAQHPEGQAPLDVYGDYGTIIYHKKKLLGAVASIYTYTYALWLLNHEEILSGRVLRSCLMNAIKWDIASSYFIVSSSLNYAEQWELRRFIPLLMDGPRTLKRYLKSHGFAGRNAAVLDQIMD
jgi:hypothetical protein